jgi:hypothetical protein
VHDRVDVPLPPVIEAGLAVHDRLVEFDVTATATLEVNPFTGAMVTVEVLAEPATPVTAVGLALTVKS